MNPPLVLSVVGNKKNYDIKVVPILIPNFVKVCQLNRKLNGEYKNNVNSLSRPVGENMGVKLFFPPEGIGCECCVLSGRGL